MSDGDLWMQQRRLLAPELRQGAVQRFLPPMVDAVEAIFAEWDAGGAGVERDISDAMMRLTVWIVGGAPGQGQEACWRAERSMLRTSLK